MGGVFVVDLKFIYFHNINLGFEQMYHKNIKVNKIAKMCNCSGPGCLNITSKQANVHLTSKPGFLFLGPAKFLSL